MDIHVDPFEPEKYLVEICDRWFSVSESEINRVQMDASKMPKLEKAELVPVWLLDKVLDITGFFTEHFYVGRDGMDAMDPRFSWL